MNCTLRNGLGDDASQILNLFNLVHGQSDFLMFYADESNYTLEKERNYLIQKENSTNEIEICAVLDGIIVGTAGIDAIGHKYKVRHRAEFGICIDKAYWSIGIGKALTKACIDCAREAGYQQLELNVVANNVNAISLYSKLGFIEYGRNPKAFFSRYCGWQEVIYMRLELT